ncbi:hypothetical protein [Streptomyces sp. NPDC001020]
MVRLGWVRSPQSIQVRFGTNRAGAIDVALYTTASIDAVIAAHRCGYAGPSAVPAPDPTRHPRRRP